MTTCNLLIRCQPRLALPTLLLAACASPIPAPIAPPPTVIAPAAEILPGEGLGFEPVPAGTPEPDPKLYLHVAPRDATTREHVDRPLTVHLEGPLWRQHRRPLSCI